MSKKDKTEEEVENEIPDQKVRDSGKMGGPWGDVSEGNEEDLPTETVLDPLGAEYSQKKKEK